MISRRGLLGAFIAGPAIVRCSSLMKLPRAPYVLRTSPLIDNHVGTAYWKYLVQVDEGPVQKFYINLAHALNRGDQFTPHPGHPTLTVLENMGFSGIHYDREHIST